MSLLERIISSVLEESETTTEISDARKKICEDCPKRKEKKCLICGCFVNIKAEMNYNYNPKKLLRLEKTHCPMGKWPYLDDKTGLVIDNDKEIANFYRSKDKEILLT